MSDGDATNEDVKGEEAEDEAKEEDELAEINGVKPKVLLADGEEMEAKSMTR
jgi:DNA ligase-1